LNELTALTSNETFYLLELSADRSTEEAIRLINLKTNQP